MMNSSTNYSFKCTFSSIVLLQYELYNCYKQLTYVLYKNQHMHIQIISNHSTQIQLITFRNT